MVFHLCVTPHTIAIFTTKAATGDVLEWPCTVGGGGTLGPFGRDHRGTGTLGGGPNPTPPPSDPPLPPGCHLISSD